MWVACSYPDGACDSSFRVPGSFAAPGSYCASSPTGQVLWLDGCPSVNRSRCLSLPLLHLTPLPPSARFQSSLPPLLSCPLPGSPWRSLAPPGAPWRSLALLGAPWCSVMPGIVQRLAPPLFPFLPFPSPRWARDQCLRDVSCPGWLLFSLGLGVQTAHWLALPSVSLLPFRFPAGLVICAPPQP